MPFQQDAAGKWVNVGVGGSSTGPTSTSTARASSHSRTAVPATGTGLTTGQDAYLACPLDVIVVGASGDLAKKKTFPSLLQLFARGFLPDECRIVGFARSEFTGDAFHDHLRPFLEKSTARPTVEAFLGMCR